MEPKNFLKIGVSAVALLAGLFVLGGSWYTIDQTERGVILRNGAISGKAQPGLGFKVPLIDSVEKISVQSHLQTYSDMHTYSFDQQPAIIKVSVSFHPDPTKVDDIYARFQNIETLVARALDPHAYQELKIVFGQFTAVSAIQNRQKLNDEVAAAITESLKDEPIIVESVQIENIDFSKAYENSIEQRMLAEVEVQKLKQNADREKVQAQITVTKAQAEADATLANARAEAEATRINGQAQADAIKARAAALGDNPQIVALTQAEKWNGVLPSQMIPNTALPILK